MVTRQCFSLERYTLVPVRYAAALWLIAMSWLFWHVPRTPQPLLAGMSLALQIAAIALLYAWVDGLLSRRRVMSFVFAGLMAVLAAMVVADTVVIALTSATLRQSLSMMINTGDVWSALTESILSAGHLAIMGCIGVAVFVLGGTAHRLLARRAVRRPRHHLIGLAGAALLGAFVAEQFIASASSSYLLRSSVLPLYVRAFSTPPKSGYTVAIPAPPSVKQRLQWLEDIAPDDDPLNVVYILLESVRGDAIDETIAPNLATLRNQSMHFVDAQANAILTLLSWNQIFFDRPPYTMPDDVRATRSDPLGALPLEILHAAGYSVRLSIADDIRLYDYDRRLVGERGAVQEVFIADLPGRAASHVEDAQATDRAIEWITQSPQEPFFIMLELASTHWTYAFDETRPIVTPYAQAMLPMHVRSQPDLDLLRNRYLNSLHQVDEQIGRVLRALEQSGVGSRTLIVVTSDHGEGFVLGRVGHSILHNDTRHVPMMFSTPAMRQGRPGSNQSPPAGPVRGVTSHSTIWPMIFEFIGVEGIRASMLTGRLSLGLDMDHGAALSFDGSLEYASLTLPQYVIEFKVRESSGTLTFTPIGLTDREGSAILPFEPELKRLPWQAVLDCLIMGRDCDDTGILRQEGASRSSIEEAGS
jgi:glucan phosphoethanolaminetransferase (alkaline phosphatase superfamily)